MNENDSFHVEITNVTEHEDGSADYEFLLGPEALKKFASIGIETVLRNSIKDLKNELLHIGHGEV